ncbi:hypothetical protein BpHYR1_025459 [Brachionus plicatilis]|uniref:Uncharacterized protein n=1 Tax=Brachionus plicatilis TaxID=10195 RepID=A0A3M7PZK7_BRAPC|nr:hypothetical protein BpHYR1_025459 [Brachionus plicatilis]
MCSIIESKHEKTYFLTIYDRVSRIEWFELILSEDWNLSKKSHIKYCQYRESYLFCECNMIKHSYLNELKYIQYSIAHFY